VVDELESVGLILNGLRNETQSTNVAVLIDSTVTPNCPNNGNQDVDPFLVIKKPDNNFSFT
jgi:hypothetical protein